MINFIDLFAGIGGFHQALKSKIFNCNFACEIDKHAAKTYYENYKIQPFSDITKISETNIPSHQLLCAGFPCQPFSISGKQKGFEDIRGTLFFHIIRIAKFHQPKVMLLENVSNLEKHNDGKTLNTIFKFLDKIGYNTFYKVINASNFGLPQNRKRIYFVCFNKKLNIKLFNFPKQKNISTSLLNFLEKEPTNAKKIDRPDIVIKKQYVPERDIFGNLILPNKPIQIGYLNKGRQGERIYSPYGHAITLSANGGGIGAKTGLYLIDNVVRKLSPRECANILGFPLSFKINLSNAQAYKQFGNSVAINVIQEIAKKIIKLI